MERGRMLTALAVAAAVATPGAGAVTGTMAAQPAAGSKVAVNLFEFKLVPSTKRVRAGQVTFVARNTGKLEHELVVLRTSRPAGKLPLKGGEAAETGAVGEISEFKPGVTKKLTLTLKPGHYALICNLSGHYKAGQFADLAVVK